MELLFEGEYVCVNFILSFVLSLFLMQFLFYCIHSVNNNTWHTLININFLRSGGYKYKHIITFSSDNDSLSKVDYIDKLFSGKKYYLSDELKKLNYDKFDINKINSAHRKICENIMRDDDCGIIVQNMRKPRDFYDLYCYILMSKNEENVMVHIETYDGNSKYMGVEFKVKDVIKDGGNLMYYKRNRRRSVNVEVMELEGKKIYYGGGEVGEIEFLDNVSNEYFEVNVYKMENREDYGVEVVRNNFEMDDKYLYFVGQYYLS